MDEPISCFDSGNLEECMMQELHENNGWTFLTLLLINFCIIHIFSV